MQQAELAEKTGIDKGQISSYISGRYKPKLENLSLMAVALDVPVEREDTGTAAIAQKQRFEVYAKQVYEMRESKRVLKLYGELTEENRSRVVRYMEKVLAVQRMEEKT